MITREQIGKAIANKRKAMSITQAQLAEQTGNHTPNISAIEKGNINLSVDRLTAILDVLNIDINLTDK